MFFKPAFPPYLASATYDLQGQTSNYNYFTAAELVRLTYRLKSVTINFPSAEASGSDETSVSLTSFSKIQHVYSRGPISSPDLEDIPIPPKFGALNSFIFINEGILSPFYNIYKNESDGAGSGRATLSLDVDASDANGYYQIVNGTTPLNPPTYTCTLLARVGLWLSSSSYVYDPYGFEGYSKIEQILTQLEPGDTIDANAGESLYTVETWTGGPDLHFKRTKTYESTGSGATANINGDITITLNWWED